MLDAAQTQIRKNSFCHKDSTTDIQDKRRQVDTDSEKEWTFQKTEPSVSQLDIEMISGLDRNEIPLIRIKNNGPSIPVTYFVQGFL